VHRGPEAGKSMVHCGSREAIVPGELAAREKRSETVSPGECLLLGVHLGGVKQGRGGSDL
jgi:hypothetical protein